MKCANCRRDLIPLFTGMACPEVNCSPGKSPVSSRKYAHLYVIERCYARNPGAWFMHTTPLLYRECKDLLVDCQRLAPTGTHFRMVSLDPAVHIVHSKFITDAILPPPGEGPDDWPHIVAP